MNMPRALGPTTRALHQINRLIFWVTFLGGLALLYAAW